MSEKPPFNPQAPVEPMTASPQPEGSQGQKPAFDPSQPTEDSNEYFGSTEQIFKTAAEQFTSGITGGFSEGFETRGVPELGIKPITSKENIEARRSENPITSFGSNALGTTALIAGTGVGGAIEAAGSAAARIGGAAALGGALGASNAASDDWSSNKPLDAQKIISSAGLGGLLGLGGGLLGEGIRYKFGSPLAKEAGAELEKAQEALPGTPKPMASELDQPKLDQGDFTAAIENEGVVPDKDVKSVLEGVKDLKPDAKDIEQAAKEIDSPLLEGMISSHPGVQRAEDALLNGPPTTSGLQRQKLYQKVYDSINKTVDESLGKGTEFSQAEVGNVLKSKLSKMIEQTVKPINEIYTGLKGSYEAIPLSERSAPAIARSLSKIQELRIAPSSPEGKLVNQVMNEIQNLKTVDDVKSYKSILNRSLSPTSSSGERHMVSVLSEKLTNLEESSIIRFAKTQMKTPEAKARIESLLTQRQMADSAYKDFRNVLNPLLEKLGKRKVYGAQDALNFIGDLTPEEIAHKLFAKKDSEFLGFFSKNFSDEMKLLADHQKSVIRQNAEKTGIFSNQVFKQVDKLQPEIQRALFTPQELMKIKAAQTVSDSIPKTFNPSKTSYNSAFYEWAKKPTTMTVAEGRDYFLKKYIQNGGGNVSSRTSQALQTKAVKTSVRMDKLVKNLFNAEASQGGKK